MSIVVNGKTVKLNRKGVGKLSLTCPATEVSGPCEGSVSARTAKKFKLKRKGRKKPVQLAKAKYSIAAGKTSKVTIKLKRPGLKLLRTRKAARKIIVTASVRDTAGNSATVRKNLKTGGPPR